ncbi:DUF86 domain-containing protein [Candidatus Woesearchaeota archaeon]|nr:DUF86 domain-containing protein [Candidatus Woesearchaeota archaeon]
MTRLTDKISELEKFLKELRRIAPQSLEEYSADIEKKAACERYVEKIVEAITDIAFFTIKDRRLKMPESDIDAFNILLENKIISEELTAMLKNAKGMRNIIAHQYGAIDDETVFEAVTKELQRDAKELVNAVKG